MIKPKTMLWPRPAAFRILTGHPIVPLKNGPVQYLTITEAGFWYGHVPVQDRQALTALYKKGHRAYAWYHAYGYGIGQEIPLPLYDHYIALIEQVSPTQTLLITR